MIDPEFEKLLRKGYGFRGNHIRILGYLGGKEASAEEIWTDTEVPRGRVYEFLEDLVEWGFVEVIGGKPRGYRLRNPRKALEMAISKKEKEITDIQRRSLEIAKTLEWVEGVEGFKVQVLGSSQEYYLKMREMAFTGNRFRAMVRKPLICLASARQTVWKRRFYEALMEQIDADLKVEYLFPLDILTKIIGGRENRDAVLNELEGILERVDLRHTPMSGQIMALAGNRVLLGFADPAERQVEKSIYIESKEAAVAFQEVFDSVFQGSRKVDMELIHKLSMA